MEIPPNWDLKVELLLKEQDYYEAYILAHVLVNGASKTVGDQFFLMGQPNEDGCSVGSTRPIGEELMKRAEEIASRYRRSYQVQRPK